MENNYILDNQIFRTKLTERGFASISEFVRHSKLHRNTLLQYLSGSKSVIPTAVSRIARALLIDPLELFRKVASHPLDDSNLDKLLVLIESLETDSDLVITLIGSRAKKTARKYSDYDLGLSGGVNRLSADKYLSIKSRIEDLVDNFAYSVDVVNLDLAPIEFLRDFDYRPVFLLGSRESFNFLLGVLEGVGQSKQIN